MTFTCCGRDRAHIDVHQGDSVLSFTMCAVCSGSSWIRDGEPTTLTGPDSISLRARRPVPVGA
jgi:hypothetical protein